MLTPEQLAAIRVGDSVTVGGVVRALNGAGGYVVSLSPENAEDGFITCLEFDAKEIQTHTPRAIVAGDRVTFQDGPQASKRSVPFRVRAVDDGLAWIVFDAGDHQPGLVVEVGELMHWGGK